MFKSSFFSKLFLYFLILLFIVPKSRASIFITDKSDHMQYTASVLTSFGLPIIAIGKTLFLKDYIGSEELIKFTTFNAITYSVMSNVFLKTSNSNMLYGLESNLAFSSSIFLLKRYGWKVGWLPSFLSIGIASVAIKYDKKNVNYIVSSLIISSISSYFLVYKYNNIGLTYDLQNKGLKLSYIFRF